MFYNGKQDNLEGDSNSSSGVILGFFEASLDFNNITYNFYKFVFCDRKDHTKCEFSVHDVFAVDLLISTGEGKTKEKDTRTTVYKKTENTYSLKMKASRGITVNTINHVSNCYNF